MEIIDMIKSVFLNQYKKNKEIKSRILSWYNLYT